VLVCGRTGLEWWRQGEVEPRREAPPVPPNKVPDFFASHADDFAPNAVYRAKTWGRFDHAHQLSFVDLGLMPLVEKDIGKELESLIVRKVRDLKSLLGWDAVSDERGQWLLKSVFWIVSAKILRDKQVAQFSTVDPLDIESLLSTVAHHFGAVRIPISSKQQRTSLAQIAADVNKFSNLKLVTTESLAYVYENALISKSTRQALGTHSTPSFLVDYVVGKLADWIADIPYEQRNVLEPACGHAAFLVSAMRLLTELLPENRAGASQRRGYLRSRIHGIENDAFALEIARLSLSLTDIPNPNGWDLLASDMFLAGELQRKAGTATILLTNPPFENFSSDERAAYRRRNCDVRYINKTAEVLSRVLPELPTNAVLGAVVPQGFLHSKNSTRVRQYLVEHFEFKEICLFPDKVFTFSDSESAVLLGRKNDTGARKVWYRRVRERGMDAFRKDYRATLDVSVDRSRFRGNFDLRVPDLEPLWKYCEKATPLGALAEVGQGFTFKGKGLSKGEVTFSQHKFPRASQGFLNFPNKIGLHELPPDTWLNLDKDVILRPRHGLTVGVAQLILNEAPTSRGPWRLKALIDEAGHPVTGRFNVVRPRSHRRTPLLFLWALCNSPVANAYAFSHAGKRHNDAGMLRKMPVPALNEARVEAIAKAAADYLAHVNPRDTVLRGRTDANRARDLLLRVDNEMLSLYALPRDLEQQLLRAFDGWARDGVPFAFEGYIPAALADPIRLSEYVAITADWPRTNRQRGTLVQKSVSETITPDEREELIQLQNLARLRRRLEAPLPIAELEKRYSELKSE
jgi:hypothetical protein